MATATQSRIEWPKRPSTRPHRTLGRRQVWQSKCGRYRIDRFIESSGRYLAGDQYNILSSHRTLQAAKRACERLARAERNRRLHHEDESRRGYARISADG